MRPSYVLGLIAACLGPQLVRAEPNLEQPILSTIRAHYEAHLGSETCRDYFRLYSTDLRNWTMDKEIARAEVAFYVEYTSSRALYGTSARAFDCLGRLVGEGFFEQGKTYQSGVFLFALSKWALGWHIDKVERGLPEGGTGSSDRLYTSADGRSPEMRGASAEDLYNQGYVHFAHGEFDEAIASYSAAIAANPDLAVAYNNRCLTRVVLGRDIPKARADCQEAVRRLPNRADIRETLGFTHLKLGEPAQALAEYNVALQINPERAIALYGRGIAKERLGDLAGAKADKAAALALQPNVEHAFGDYSFWW